MRIYNSINDIDEKNDSVVILGKFDGIHMGHQMLLKKAEQISSDKKMNIAVFTFMPSAKQGSLLTTDEERYAIFSSYGVDYIVECAFEDIKDMAAEEFLQQVIIEKMKAAILVAGTDCSFGKNRSGDAAMAVTYMENAGKSAVILDKVKYKEKIVSSSYIREKLTGGSIEDVNNMLGYDYFFDGTVRSGNKIGRTLDFPTINLVPENNKALPPYGVYYTNVYIDGVKYCGITNIGIKPTVGSKRPVVETYIMDYNSDAYGKGARVCLLRYARPEHKFNNLEELRKQIAEDVSGAERYFGKR